MGKGNWYRTVDKKKFDESYDHIFEKKCPHCNGAGEYKYHNEKIQNKVWTICPKCKGIGKIKC